MVLEIVECFQNVVELHRTGYAALSWNGAKEKLRSAATCFSLRSDKARAAARRARVVDEESAKHERASCLLIPARVADFLYHGYRERHVPGVARRLV